MFSGVGLLILILCRRCCLLIMRASLGSHHGLRGRLGFISNDVRACPIACWILSSCVSVVACSSEDASASVILCLVLAMIASLCFSYWPLESVGVVLGGSLATVVLIIAYVGM